jgi:hypothetical protein
MEVRRLVEDAQRENNLLDMIQYSGMPERLEAELRAFEAEPYDVGEAIIELGGGVWRAPFGLDLAMASKAIESYCHVVEQQANLLSDDTHRAPLQFVTTVGGLGFTIHEIDRPEGVRSHAAQAIHDVAVAMADVIADPGACSRIGRGPVDPLIIALSDFFRILDDAKAVLNVIEGEFDHLFSAEDIHRGWMHLTDAGFGKRAELLP